MDKVGDELDARIRLMRAEYKRAHWTARVMDHFGMATEVVRAGKRGLVQVDGIGKHRASELWDAISESASDDERRVVNGLDLACLTPGDEEYPVRLRVEPERPRFLWRRGRPLNPTAPRLAVVGTRRATEYGLRMTTEIVIAAAAHGIVIVSGLAFGIDRAAHEAALEAGGTTEAVLGNGPENIYPARHKQLGKRICESGALLSEFPIGTPPLKQHFPRRNRIISGLAAATVVVEAYERGGALITGRTAVEQGRQVFAVPGRIDHHSSAGTNGMLRDGEAHALTSPDDIVQYYVHAGLIADTSRRTPKRSKRLRLSADDHLILAAVGQGETHIETIRRECDLPPEKLWTGILLLERNGLLDELNGNRYRWSARARRHLALADDSKRR